jgi:hypothetical protein
LDLHLSPHASKGRRQEQRSGQTDPHSAVGHDVYLLVERENDVGRQAEPDIKRIVTPLVVNLSSA